MTPTRLLIIDDHQDVRGALKARLEAKPGIDIVGCTGCWKKGLSTAISVEPDVILLETKRDDGHGLEALSCLKEQCPVADVIVLTSYADVEERAEARSRGAARYLLKDIDTGHLAREIQSVAGT